MTEQEKTRTYRYLRTVLANSPKLYLLGGITGMPIVYFTTGFVPGWNVWERVLFTAGMLFLHVALWFRCTLRGGAYDD